jgi:KipI family sensor histidine kinase inhibitor
MSPNPKIVQEPTGDPAFPGGAYPRFLPVGDLGLTVEFGEAIDPDLNAAVIGLDLALAAAEIAGIVETMPTYRSLLICYEPAELNYEELVRHVRRLLGRNRGRPRRPGRHWTVPVAYGGQHGPDLDEVAATLKLRPEQVIGAHAGTDYLVYLVGFNPGAPNLGGLPPQLHIPRRKTPHPQVPAGSVAIGGMQTGITSIAIPTGWHLLGRTPVRPFEPRREEPFLFSPGDRIRFRPIDPAEYDDLAAAAADGATVVRPDA